jgi:hypothetical protein
MHYARAALDGLGGVPEWKGYGADGWNQAAINARWAQMGQNAPAPLVPLSMVGWFTGAGRAGFKLEKPKGKNARWFTSEERDFSNYWGKVAVDPYHKDSGISKVAGGILKVASIALPAFSLIETAASAGNMGLQLQSMNSDAALSTRVMAPALAEQEKSDAADFKAQIDKLNALAPQLVKGPSAAVVAQNNFAAAGVPVSARKVSYALPVILFTVLAGAYMVARR